MPDSNPLPGERSMPRIERRKPDPSTVQAWEALSTTEAELSATRAKLASTLEALNAAREREERLLRMLERREVRLPHLAVAVAVAVVIGVVLTFVAVRYQEALGVTSANRTSMVQQDVGPPSVSYSC